MGSRFAERRLVGHSFSHDVMHSLSVEHSSERRWQRKRGARPHARWLSVALLLAAILTLFKPASANEPLPAAAPDVHSAVQFGRDIRPIFAEHCLDCHGPDTQEADLRLDSKASVLRGGESGEPAVVPGNSDRSELIRRVTSAQVDLRMPSGADPLSKRQIALLRTWIDQGAPWPRHEDSEADTPAFSTDFWSFQPLQRPAVPKIDDSWISGPVDSFIFNRLRKNQLRPSPPADRGTLIRRLYLDMLGLPPTPVDVDAFRIDSHPDAYPRLVDRVLASPHYGERWARHWLDVVRFAETDGFEMNQERAGAWRYRDYVIDALGDDKPYDEFIFEQLAGDAVGVHVAAGFLVGGAYDKVKSPDLALTLMQRQDELADMINTTGTALLGLTLGCARCHNHKFDPVLQKDYYALQAVFAGVKHGERRLPGPQTVRIRDQVAALNAHIAQLEKEAEKSSDGSSEDAGPKQKPAVSQQEREKRLAILRMQRDELAASGPKLYAGIFEQPEPTRRLYRGDPMSPREIVAPDALTVLGSLSLDVETREQQRRVALARWIADPDNPLTARVMVNRIWHYHFGRGIVATPSDFGRNGAPPSHAELLDWLAVEFLRSGWSLKHVHRLILLSSTYRQASAPREKAMRVDADARFLWRFPPRRLEAEAIRDNILAVSGALDPRMGGPGFSLFQPNDNYVRVYTPKEKFGHHEFRRMIYMTKVRMETDDVFGAFDCPDAGQVQPMRSRSTTPIQALNLFNSSFTVQQCRLMAKRLKREAGTEIRQQIRLAFRLCYGREPDENEQQVAERLIAAHGLPALCRAMINTNEFLFIP